MFSESDLLALAGPIVFGRGLDYVEFVAELRIKGESAVARIDGPRRYRTRLTWVRYLYGDCTCPHNAEGNFCKHLVAVGLATIESTGPADPSVPATSVDDLVALVNAAMPRGYVDYYNALPASRPIHSALDTLERLVDAGDTGDTRPALERALTRLRKVRVDDSEGEFGWASQRAADLHARACAGATLDAAAARKLGRWLARFRADSPGWPETTLAMYAAALGDPGLKAYRAAVTKLATTADSYEIAQMQLELADHDSDVDEAVRLLAGRDPLLYAGIIDRLTAAGRSAEALDWLDRAVAADRLARHPAGANSAWIAPADAVDRYLDAGRPERALDVARRTFTRELGPETMQFVVDVARRVGVEAAERAWAMSLAEAQAARVHDGAALVLIALAERDVVAAWSAVERFGVGRAWRALAQASANDLPIAAADLYRPELDRLLLFPNTQNYPEVVKILRTMRNLYARVGEGAAIDAFIADLREKYRRRTSLLAHLDRAHLG